MRTFWQNLRHGAQVSLKNPGFALVVALTLLWPTATAITCAKTSGSRSA
jgi:hypothetical protein